MQLALKRREGPAIRDFAIEALAPLARKRRRVIKVLSDALSDESTSVRWSAAWALGHSEDPDVIPLLQSLLEDESSPPGNTRVKDAALEAIADLEASRVAATQPPPNRSRRWLRDRGRKRLVEEA